MKSLGQLLLAEKLVTAAQLDEALEMQVVHGGRLGTNLVELGFLKEAELARMLGKHHAMPFASGEMKPDPQALKIADADFYDDNDVLPMRLDATRLTVSIINPGDMKPLDALGFKAGLRVVPVLIPEFRMNQLQRKHCGAFRPMRPIDMNSLRPSRVTGSAEPARPVDPSELINEDDFAKLYADAMGGPAEHEEVITGEEVIEPVPSAPWPVAPRASAPAAPAAPEVAAPEAAPMTFAEATAALAQSSDREAIAQVVLRFARSKFKRVLILAVQGDLVTGWHGMGPGVQDKLVRRIGVSLREPNTFKLVRDLRSHFVGVMKRTPGMEVFYKLLGGGFPGTAVVMPLLVRGKPVHLLYVDDGPGEVTPPDVGELMIVAQGVARSYEALFARRKAARYAGAPTPAPR